MKQLLVRVLPEFHRELKIASVREGVSMGEIIMKAVREYLTKK